MMAKSRVSLSVRLTLFVVVCALVAIPAMAQVAKQGNDVLSSLAFVHEKLQAPDQIEPLDNVRALADKSLQNGWEAFQDRRRRQCRLEGHRSTSAPASSPSPRAATWPGSRAAATR